MVDLNLRQYRLPMNPNKFCQFRKRWTKNNSWLEHQRDLIGLLYLKCYYIQISPSLIFLNHSDNPLWSKHFSTFVSSWLSWSPTLQIWSNSHSCSKILVVPHMIHLSSRTPASPLIMAVIIWDQFLSIIMFPQNAESHILWSAENNSFYRLPTNTLIPLLCDTLAIEKGIRIEKLSPFWSVLAVHPSATNPNLRSDFSFF